MLAIECESPESIHHPIVEELVGLLDHHDKKELNESWMDQNLRSSGHLEIGEVLKLPQAKLITVLCALLVTEFEVTVHLTLGNG